VSACGYLLIVLAVVDAVEAVLLVRRVP